ncbi:MAG: hypothetical protein JXA30_12100 [Deltaproteobacteria bacterium]|nr:hypothetical protein [Deltaproteobacteria bacterium]
MVRPFVVLLWVLLATCVIDCGGTTPRAEEPRAEKSVKRKQAKQREIVVRGGNGSSCNEAIVILGADAFSGVRAEYYVIGKFFPGYERLSQVLTECNGKPADVINIKTKEGKTVRLYFDVSDFYGKLE